MPSVTVPELEINTPEISLPEWKLPDFSPEVLQAFRMQSGRLPDFITGANQVSEIINQQYSYHTVNQTVQNPEQRPIEMTFYSTVEMDGQTLGTAVRKIILDENTENGGWFI